MKEDWLYIVNKFGAEFKYPRKYPYTAGRAPDLVVENIFLAARWQRLFLLEATSGIN